MLQNKYFWIDMATQKISAVIITLDEERNIRRAIDSVIGVVDEVLVLDSGSRDKTVDIAKNAGAKIHQIDWAGYASTKNKGHDLASGSYILSIDADEALSDPLQKSIKELNESDLEGYYSMNRMTNYCGQWIQHSGWYPDTKVRLFPKNTRWEGKHVHESLNLDSSIAIHHMQGDILHYSYYSRKEHKTRADHYSKLTAKKLFEKNKKANRAKPFLSGIVRFIGMYFIKGGILDGMAGWHIARISAQSNIIKYKTLRKLNNEQ